MFSSSSRVQEAVNAAAAVYVRAPPPLGGGLPSLSFLDLGRRRRGWVLCLPPAPPPPRPLRRLPPRPGPGAERPERVGQNINFRKKRTYQVYRYYGSEALQPPPDTGRRPRRCQVSTQPWSHHISRAGSKETWHLRDLERILQNAPQPHPRQGTVLGVRVRGVGGCPYFDL
jgi:hypothetical protein